MQRRPTIETTEALRQHQLVILRRLRSGPLTEFELAGEIAAHSGWSVDDATDRLPDWLEELRVEGLIWSGALVNAEGTSMLAAALTRAGRELVC